MKLVKEIESKRNKNGILKKWAIFKCPFCFQEVERQLGNGLRQKSCGCAWKRLLSESHMGITCTEEAKTKISLANTGKKRTEEFKLTRSENYKGENNPNYGNGDKISGEKNYWYDKGFLFLGENNPNYGNGDKISGENNPMYGKYGKEHPAYGYKHTEEARQKIKESHEGEKNPQWQNGISFEPYSPEFNKELKRFVLERDSYTCQDPNCDGNHTKLHIHHIDYVKKNNNSENLMTLCSSCHSKTNGKNNRNYFTEFYQTIIMNKLMECLL